MSDAMPVPGSDAEELEAFKAEHPEITRENDALAAASAARRAARKAGA